MSGGLEIGARARAGALGVGELMGMGMRGGIGGERSGMSHDRLEEAKERVVDEAIAYCARPAGSGSADELRDAIDDFVDLAGAVVLASFAQAAFHVASEKKARRDSGG